MSSVGHDEPTQGVSPAHCDIGVTRSSWVPLSSGAETLAPIPFLCLDPVFLARITDPAYLITCSVTAHHGDAPLLFHKTNRGTDGWGLPRGQGQLSQLPCLVHVPPPDIYSLSFEGGIEGEEGWREDPTVAVARLNVLPTASFPVQL